MEDNDITLYAKFEPQKAGLPIVLIILGGVFGVAAITTGIVFAVKFAKNRRRRAITRRVRKTDFFK